jgi:pimeloyl-ACP methyl ester carboxylesterase
MTSTLDVTLSDGRIVRVHDGGAIPDSSATVFWHHGSPQTGALLPPVLDAATARGMRLVSYGRAGYGGSSPLPGRDVASAASDVGGIADALGLDRFAVMGASGGAPHALACAALLPDRITAVVCFASPAPFDASDIDGWFAGMASDGAGLRAALDGPEARAAHQEIAEFDPDSFIPADYTALDGEWAGLGEDVAASEPWGTGGQIADDLAFVAPWGFELDAITAPVLLVQGGLDRVIPAHHARRLHDGLPTSELWEHADDGHISVLGTLPDAFDWLLARSTR